MKKKYTKKQILESIKYWKKQLNENYASNQQSVNDLLDEIDDFAEKLVDIKTPFDPYEIQGRVNIIKEMLGLEKWKYS